ncbi:MAG: nuclear transport factor 2 family protein, partial [Candidatus Binatia bacterium]
GDSDAAAALWDDDGVLDSDLSHLEGPAAVAEMVLSEGQQSLIRQGCAHVQGFPVLTVEGDRATATGYSRVYRHTDEGHEVWRVSANHWEFRRTPSGWRVTRRTNRVIDGGPEARDVLGRALGGKS